MSGQASQVWLGRLLIYSSCMLFLAMGAVFLPSSAMGWVHRWLGLGDLPSSPIVEYLTRSLSLLYAYVGLLAFCLRREVLRYLPLLKRAFAGGLVFGCFMLGIDLSAGLPVAWVLVEVGAIFLLNGIGLLLTRQIEREQAAQQIPRSP